MAAGVALVAVVALGGTAFGAVSSIPDGSGVIHGCYASSSGALKVIDPSVTSKCPAGYTALTWNQKGPAGTSVTSTALNPGNTNCLFGGSSFTSASGTTYACNGAPGAPGQNGSNGKDGTSVTSNPVPSGDPNCPNGGAMFTSASPLPTYACNGAAGAKGDTGAPGPAGISEGVQAFSSTEVFFPKAQTFTQVMQTPNVPTTGDYYVSASILTWIDSTDGVFCVVNGGNDVPAEGAGGSATGFHTISVVDDVHVTAGSPIAMSCGDYQADPNTYFYQGDVNAILINNDNGVTAGAMRQAARAPSFPRHLSARPAK